jgi:hypothetical protein
VTSHGPFCEANATPLNGSDIDFKRIFWGLEAAPRTATAQDPARNPARKSGFLNLTFALPRNYEKENRLMADGLLKLLDIHRCHGCIGGKSTTTEETGHPSRGAVFCFSFFLSPVQGGSG